MSSFPQFRYVVMQGFVYQQYPPTPPPKVGKSWPRTFTHLHIAGKAIILHTLTVQVLASLMQVLPAASASAAGIWGQVVGMVQISQKQHHFSTLGSAR